MVSEMCHLQPAWTKRSQKVNKFKKTNRTINVFVFPRIHGVLKKKTYILIIPRIADWFSNLTTKDVYKPVGVNMWLTLLGLHANNIADIFA